MVTAKRRALALLCLAVLVPLALAQSTPAATPGVAGSWQGKLVAGHTSLRIWLEVAPDANGKLAATVISLDQGATPIPCTHVTLQGRTFRFQVPAVKGSYSGRLSPDGSSIDGTWTQGRSLPLAFQRQPKGSRPPIAAASQPRAAQPPVPLDELQAALDHEFHSVVGTTALKASAGVGIVIGVLQNGHRHIYAYGAARPDSIFEIGSVTKTFTGLVLAQLVAQRQLALDQPVRNLLPPGTVAKPSGPEITLLDLATQHSGLPRLPANLQATADPTNPYARYGATELYAFLRRHGLAAPHQPVYLYSNLGYGLLGFALARHAGEPYGQLVASEITAPLHMTSTGVRLSSSEKARFAHGHDAANARVPAWTFEALAGAGALRSSAADLLTLLAAELHPASIVAGTDRGPRATLSQAIGATQRLRADGPEGMKVGMGWLFQPRDGMYWHNGGTGGATSFIGFQPAHDRALVVLYNREDIGSGPTPFAQRVAANVLALLAGTPAPPLP